jgi:hypothetical protein
MRSFRSAGRAGSPLPAETNGVHGSTAPYPKISGIRYSFANRHSDFESRQYSRATEQHCDLRPIAITSTSHKFTTHLHIMMRRFVS